MSANVNEIGGQADLIGYALAFGKQRYKLVPLGSPKKFDPLSLFYISNPKKIGFLNLYRNSSL